MQTLESENPLYFNLNPLQKMVEWYGSPVLSEAFWPAQTLV